MIIFTKGKDAFHYAFDNYTDTVFRVAVHNTNCTADAEDITQEVFVKLLQCEKVFRGEEHLKAWLIRTTINLCIDEHRKSSRVSLTDKPVDENVADKTDDIIDSVKALPTDYRNAIYLHYYEGYTAKEIGKILNAKPNTVLSWLSRGREMLKKEMTGGIENE